MTRFWPGFAAGVAVTIALMQFVAALLVVPGMRSMLGDFGAQLPFVTRLATSHGWSWGAPVVVLAATWFGIVSRPSGRRGLLIALPLGALGALAFTIWACYLPMFQLAGSIKPD